MTRPDATYARQRSVTPRLLDLFCCAGGMSVGYARAGFAVWGVDKIYRKDYPFPCLVADALDVLADEHFTAMFDVIHASPPCQENSRTQHLRDAQGREVKEDGLDLLDPVRDALRQWADRTGGLYVIENVPGASMTMPITLCGSAFGLKVRRHRLFESNAFLVAPPLCDHERQGRPVGVYGSLNDDIPEGGRTARTMAEAGEAMGIDWMRRWDDLKEAIPPAYAQWLGEQLLPLASERVAA